jgi:hypothetical protein
MGRFIGPLALCAIVLSACSASPTTEGPAATLSPHLTTSVPSPASPIPSTIPKPPEPVVVTGHGARVKKIRLEADSPLVATASHTGAENFIVHLVPSGGGEEVFLFNEIGSFKGQAASDEISSGPYRLRVEADGSWRIKLEQPVPTGNEKELVGTFRGRGQKVLRVQVLSEIQPTVRGSTQDRRTSSCT